MTNTQVPTTSDGNAAPSLSGTNLSDRLVLLAAMRAAGELTDSEFEAAKHDEFTRAHMPRAETELPALAGATPTVEIAGSLARYLNDAHVAEITGDEEILAAEPFQSFLDWKIGANDAHHRKVGLRGADGAFVVTRPSADAPWEVQPVPAKHRGWVLVTAVVAAMALAGAGAYSVTNRGPGTDARYMKALTDRSLVQQFSSPANAVAHAHEVCRGLNNGGAQQGMPADKIAVDNYCPKFARGFKVLETAIIIGAFVLKDTSIYSSAIVDNGSSCDGAGGFSDIQSGTGVVVKNDAGTVLARTVLGTGTGDTSVCTFPFSFAITQGENDYVVSVSHRGETSYTFAELKNTGVQLSMGS